MLLQLNASSSMRSDSSPPRFKHWILLPLGCLVLTGLLWVAAKSLGTHCDRTDSAFCDLKSSLRSMREASRAPATLAKHEPRIQTMTLPAGSQPTSGRSGVGVNVGAYTEWSSEFAFIDQFKRAQAWIPGCDAHLSSKCSGFSNGASAWDTLEYAKIPLDEQGWVRSLPAFDDPGTKFTHVKAVLFHQDGRHRPPGRYIVRYDGQGEIKYEVAGRKVNSESRPGRDVVEVSATVPEGLVIKLVAVRVENPIRNIRVIPPGGVCGKSPEHWVPSASDCKGQTYQSLEELDAPGRFHPRFLEDMRGYRAIRFLDWLHTNGTLTQEWSARTRPEDAFWQARIGSALGASAHVPYEHMFALAHELKADAWINLPPHVSDDYVRNFAQLARQHLKGRTLLYLEYGNEPWNFAYPYGVDGAWYTEQARSKWPDSKQPAHVLKLNWYALRAAQICRQVRSELGDAGGQLRCVMNSQAANAEITAQLLSCSLAAPELGRPCGKEFDALAVAPYFGHEIIQNLAPGAFNSDEEAVRRIFLALSGSTPAIPGEANELARVRGWIAATSKLAKLYDIPMIAYEGGQNLVARDGGSKEADTRALTLANRDPRMAGAYAQNLNDWQDFGGGLMMYYLATGAPAATGAWGLKEGQFASPTPKWEQVDAFKNSPCWWNGC